MIPILLKKLKNVNFCDTFESFELGNIFLSLYNKTNPQKNLLREFHNFDYIKGCITNNVASYYLLFIFIILRI